MGGPAENKLYYERTLPHWHPEGKDLFITWRLSGSLPAKVMQALRASRTREMGKRFREFDIELDRADSEPLWLRDPSIADMVTREIEHAENTGLARMHAWVVMANHVHLLVRPQAPIAEITRKIKGRTARQGNLLLGRVGKPFWQDESFDHWVRNEGEFEKVKKYIERNPVVAGLVKQEKDWKWSSASEERPQAEACATVRG